MTEVFSTGANRDNRRGKGRYDLIPWSILRRLAMRFEIGGYHYGDRNWERGQPYGRYLDSCLRHLDFFVEGNKDEDHGIAALWNLLALVWTEERVRSGLLPDSLDDLKINTPRQEVKESP